MAILHLLVLLLRRVELPDFLELSRELLEAAGRQLPDEKCLRRLSLSATRSDTRRNGGRTGRQNKEQAKRGGAGAATGEIIERDDGASGES